jgi:intracellular sulfur oxidation DsrE/DsrF family protein
MTETPRLHRRTFFSRLAGGVAAFTAGAGTAAAQSAPSSPFQPARHPEDDWYDSLPGKHRFFVDTNSPLGAGDGLGFASNFLAASRSGYNLGDGDSAIVMCVRHDSTPYAWIDDIWAKYGEHISKEQKFNDPKTNKLQVINMYMTTGYGDLLPNREITLSALAKRGVHYAVCGLSTRKYAGIIARATGSTSDAIFKELTSNMIPNAHLVAAGVVAVNRAQERGYTLLYVG